MNKSGDEQSVRKYVGAQTGEQVVHVELAGSEQIGPTRHDIWDVRCAESRWWVISNMMNLYSQADFKSRDVALTFHVGLMVRVAEREHWTVPLTPSTAAALPGSWRRWEQAVDAFLASGEPEDYQAVGVRLRETLLSFLDEVRDEDPAPAENDEPKRSDFPGWVDLLANNLAPGESAARLRSLLKKTAVGTWDYVNWLTHAKNAVRLDAEIGLKAVEHLLGTFLAAFMRAEAVSDKCAACGSYQLVAGVCRQCGWVDPEYESELPPELSEEEGVRRLAEPCTPSSDISTFMRPNDLQGAD